MNFFVVHKCDASNNYNQTFSNSALMSAPHLIFVRPFIQWLDDFQETLYIIFLFFSRKLLRTFLKFLKIVLFLQVIFGNWCWNIAWLNWIGKRRGGCELSRAKRSIEMNIHCYHNHVWKVIISEMKLNYTIQWSRKMSLRSRWGTA